MTKVKIVDPREYIFNTLQEVKKKEDVGNLTGKQHLIAFLGKVNELARAGYEFRGMLYNSVFESHAALIFVETGRCIKCRLSIGKEFEKFDNPDELRKELENHVLIATIDFGKDVFYAPVYLWEDGEFEKESPLQEAYEKETGKNAKWRGTETKAFKEWSAIKTAPEEEEAPEQE